MKKYLNEMTFDEVMALVKNNSAFAGIVETKTTDEFWAWTNEEYFYGIGFDYTAGSLYAGNFTFFWKEKDIDVADHLERLQERNCFFSDENYLKVKRYIDLARREDKIGWQLSYEDEERLWNRVRELRTEVERLIEDILDANYEYASTHEALAEYVLNYPEQFEGYYIEDGYTVRMEVHYIQTIA